jgi:hypothetical protein
MAQLQLALIVPDEVKVDLANFDVKLRKNFLYVCILYVLHTLPIPAETSCKYFLTSSNTSKNDVLMCILTS